MFVNAAMKRKDEPREACGRQGRRGEGATYQETGVGCALQQLGTKEACCYYACWRFLRGDKLGPGR